MILLIMGLLDLVSGISVFFAKFGILYKGCVVLGGYLILKGLVFLKSVSSILDIVSGIIIILLVIGYGIPFYWLVAIWLIQKGAISILSL